MSTTHLDESTSQPAGPALGLDHRPRSPRRTRDGRDRSLAWIFYALLSLFGAIALLSHLGVFSFWLAEALLLLYTRYLYRGGRWVVFFWIS